MQTNKQKDKGINAKLQLINIISTLNLFNFLIVSLNEMYVKHSRETIGLLCLAGNIQEDKGYFYKVDLYNGLHYTYNSFDNVFRRHKDCFRCLDPGKIRYKRYIFSESGISTLQSFYSIFIEQLSKSVN